MVNTTNYEMLNLVHGEPMLAVYFKKEPVLVRLTGEMKIIVTHATDKDEQISTSYLEEHIQLIRPHDDWWRSDMRDSRVGDVVASSMGWLEILEIDLSRSKQICLGTDLWCDLDGKFDNDVLPSVFVEPPQYMALRLGPKPKVTVESVLKRIHDIVYAASNVDYTVWEDDGTERVKESLQGVLNVLSKVYKKEE